MNDHTADEHDVTASSNEQIDEQADEQTQAEADEAQGDTDQAADDQATDDQATDTEADDAEAEATDTDPYEQIAQLGDDLALARADLYNLNQQYNNYVRRSKEAASDYRVSGQAEVLEALIPVLDDIQAARDAGDLQDGPFAAIAEKLERAMETGFKLERYGEVGQEFDPNLHDALMAQESDEVDKPTIGQVLQPGYKAGDKVLRPTKVLVHNPA